MTLRWCQGCEGYRPANHVHPEPPPSLFDPIESKSYRGAPPYEAGSATSEAAAASMIPAAPTLRTRVLDAIRRAPEGLTDDEIERALDLRHQTASARRRELVLAGLIEAAGKRRTSSGRLATIWRER